MFKKISTLLFVLMASVTSTAMAKGEPIVIDGKTIVINDASYVFFSSKRKFSTGVEGRAVFVPVTGKNIQKMARERLESSGIHTVDEQKDATMVIFFNTSGSVSLESADNAASHTLLTLEGVKSNALPAISAGVVAGPAAAIGFLTGMLFDSTKITAMVATTKKVAEPEVISNGVSVDYSLEKGDGKATDDVIFKALVDQWIKFTFILPEKQTAIEAVKAEN